MVQNTSSYKPVLLIFPFGYLSHYLRCLVLARHLSKQFDIRFASHREYDGFVTAEGYSTFLCESFDEQEVLASARNFDFSWMNSRSLYKAFNAQTTAINAYRPAAVLGDAMPALKMAAEKSGVPFISLLNGYMSRYYGGIRSLSRTHPFFKPVSKLPPKLRSFITSFGEKLAMRQVHSPFRQLRAALKLRPQKSFLDEMEGDCNFICDLQSLFPQKALPPNYRVIGPLIYNAPPTLENIGAKMDQSRKTIFVSMGSTGDWSSVSWLNAPEFSGYNIITAGDKQGIISGSNVLPLRFAAASEVLPLTDVVICQGGNGTIYQALSYGVPLLCRSTHFEQEWNSAAIEKAGLGQSIDTINQAGELARIVDRWAAKKREAQFSTFRKQITESEAELSKQPDLKISFTGNKAQQP